MVMSFIGVLLCSKIIGLIFNTTTPCEHNYYACACNEAPILTEPQAITVGIAFFIVLAMGLFFIIRLLKFSKWEQLIALIIFALINYGVYSTAVEILHTQVSG